MPFIKKLLFLLSVLIALHAAVRDTCLGSEYRLSSPGGEIEFVLYNDGHQLLHEVRLHGEPVIERSPLRIEAQGKRFGRGVRLTEVKRSKIDESHQWRGVHAMATHRSNAALLTLDHPPTGYSCNIEVRVCNDGIAYRWVLPADGDAPRTIAETSEFRLPAGSTVWLHGMQGHYEAAHQQAQIEQIDQGTWAAPPVTFKLPGGRAYASITEAALVDYSGMALRATGNGGFRIMLGPDHPVSTPFRLRYEDDIERMSQPAAMVGSVTTPWRVVIVGKDLDTLVNSDIVHNLCPPASRKYFPEGFDTPWIKPGRAVWRYLDGGDRSLQGMKDFARMAGELGFEYNILEAFWEQFSEQEIRELVDYSRAHGVGLWFWKHSKELRTPEAREEFFRSLADWGVVGAKIDFFDHEHRDVVNHYAELLEAAAKHKILVNFHGANKPTGESRTWPNELVREGVRGMESRSLKSRARHDATLPFTRLLAGHADYTPTHFGDRRGDTTWTHQIATAAAFTSPLLTYAAHPRTLLDNPAVEMINSIPATWDETRVLPPSEIGDVAVLARRSGKTWFLVVVNGPEGRSFDVPLSFLGETDYSCLLVSDCKKDAASLRVARKTFSQTDTISVEVSKGGGFIARLIPTASLATSEFPPAKG